MFKVNNKNTRTSSEMVKRIETIRPQEPTNFLSVFDHLRCRSGVFIIKFEHISHLFLVDVD